MKVKFGCVILEFNSLGTLNRRKMSLDVNNISILTVASLRGMLTRQVGLHDVQFSAIKSADILIYNYLFSPAFKSKPV